MHYRVFPSLTKQIEISILQYSTVDYSLLELTGRQNCSNKGIFGQWKSRLSDMKFRLFKLIRIKMNGGIFKLNLYNL